MIKAFLRDLVWMDEARLTPHTVYFIKNDLTIVPRATSEFGDAPEPIRLYKQAHGEIGVPKFYFRDILRLKASEKFELEIDPRIGLHKLRPLEFTPTLRPEDQAPDFRDFLTRLRAQQGFGGGIFSAYTSYGKSIFSSKLIHELGLKTLLLVHTNPLREQWLENIPEYLPGIKAVPLDGLKTDFHNADVVIATLQSLMGERSDKYPEEFFRAFGTVIGDEIHRFGGAQFGSVIQKFASRYNVGVSGTVRRADGCEKVFYYCTGQILTVANETNRLRPLIWVKDSGFQGYVRPTMKKPFALGKLVECRYRNATIANDIFRAKKQGRSPLVVSDRLEALEQISYMVKQLAKQEGLEFSHGFFTGAVKKEDRKLAQNADIIFATQSIAKEGIDIKHLDTLFLVTPNSDTEQVAGRIVRRKNKFPPVVVDYVDSKVSIFYRSYHSRRKLYEKLQFKIKGIEEVEAARRQR